MSSTVLYLVRSTETPFGTFGTLLTDKGHPLIITLENPWRNNEPFVSCIPVGTYAFNRHLSPKFGETFIVEGVPERTNILVHRGNQHSDTSGCILTGEGFYYFNQPTKPGVVNPGIEQSGVAFKKFMNHMDGIDKATLCVRKSTVEI